MPSFGTALWASFTRSMLFRSDTRVRLAFNHEKGVTGLDPVSRLKLARGVGDQHGAVYGGAVRRIQVLDQQPAVNGTEAKVLARKLWIVGEMTIPFRRPADGHGSGDAYTSPRRVALPDLHRPTHIASIASKGGLEPSAYRSCWKKPTRLPRLPIGSPLASQGARAVPLRFEKS
jgi:hypothetical protein